MTTVLELAAHADLPVETVLRVLMREPTNEGATQRVAEAVAELGPPEYPRPGAGIQVVEDAKPSPAAAPASGHELALELRELFRELVDRLDRERRERINDVALTTDLVADGWRNVDRRLGRLEKIVERIDREEYFGRRRGEGREAEVRRLDDVRRPGA